MIFAAVPSSYVTKMVQAIIRNFLVKTFFFFQNFFFYLFLVRFSNDFLCEEYTQAQQVSRVGYDIKL